MGTASDLDTLLEALDRADTAVRALYRQLADNPDLAAEYDAGLRALCLGLLARFKWDRDFVRHSSAVALLKSEKSKFNTMTTPRYVPGAVDALDTFSTRIEAIYLNEVAEFVEQARALEPASSGLDESSVAKRGPKHAGTRRSK